MGLLSSKQSSIWVALVASCALSGCCQLQSVANSFSHWGETRAAEPPEPYTPGCVVPTVSLQPPDGYLAEGATFAGDQITGPPAKTAVDRMVELDDEINQLRGENGGLRQQLESAQQTIQEQGRAIDTAGGELKRALNDYGIVRQKLETWDEELESLNGRVRQTFQQQQQLLNQFEDELEGMLTEYDSAAPVGGVTLRLPSKPSRRTGPIEQAFSDPMPTAIPGYAEELPPSSNSLSVPIRLLESPDLLAPTVDGRGEADNSTDEGNVGVSLAPPRNLKRPTVLYVK